MKNFWLSKSQAKTAEVALFILLLDKLVMFRAFPYHFCSTFRTFFFYATGAFLMRRPASAFWANTRPACAHFMFAF
jgi:hypothetical protein